MATYVLIPGASSDSWYWHRVVPALRRLGHDVVTPDLPCADDGAGLVEYADTVVQAIGDRRDLVVVAQSMGAFTAPLVCERVTADLLVMVAGMVPTPGESPGAWWGNTGHEQAKRAQDEREGRPTDGPFDAMTTFLHDVPAPVAAEAMARGEVGQSGTPFAQPYPLKAWPDVPIRFVLCRGDRFFPPDFQRDLVRRRLGITPVEMDGGHLPALAHPQELVDVLETLRKEAARAR